LAERVSGLSVVIVFWFRNIGKSLFQRLRFPAFQDWQRWFAFAFAVA
jgi:hypothetical protein